MCLHCVYNQNAHRERYLDMVEVVSTLKYPTADSPGRMSLR